MLKKISQITDKGIDYSITSRAGITNNLGVWKDNKDYPKNYPEGSPKLPAWQWASWLVSLGPDLTFPQSNQVLGSQHFQQLSKELSLKLQLSDTQIQLHSRGLAHVWRQCSWYTQASPLLSWMASTWPPAPADSSIYEFLLEPNHACWGMPEPSCLRK